MHPTSTPSAHTAKQVALLRKDALSYPEAHEDFPWGHSAFKVRGKAFAFLHADAHGFSISVKLPESNALALHLPFAEPTGYGLGKSGWITARFISLQRAPLQVLSAWLEESYMAIAPKRVLKTFLGSLARGPARFDNTESTAPRAVKSASKTKTAAKAISTSKPKRAAKKAPAKRSAPPKRKGAQKPVGAAARKPRR